jgi:hypothetical protein
MQLIEALNAIAETADKVPDQPGNVRDAWRQ